MTGAAAWLAVAAVVVLAVWMLRPELGDGVHDIVRGCRTYRDRLARRGVEIRASRSHCTRQRPAVRFYAVQPDPAPYDWALEDRPADAGDPAEAFDRRQLIAERAARRVERHPTFGGKS